MSDNLCTCGATDCTGLVGHGEPDHLMVDGVELRTVLMRDWIAAEKRYAESKAAA